jgi:hypothetical protein
MYGSNLGYSSRTLERIARWALDLTLDFAPEVMLWMLVTSVYAKTLNLAILFLKHLCGSVKMYSGRGMFAKLTCCGAKSRGGVAVMLQDR